MLITHNSSARSLVTSRISHLESVDVVVHLMFQRTHDDVVVVDEAVGEVDDEIGE